MFLLLLITLLAPVPINAQNLVNPFAAMTNNRPKQDPGFKKCEDVPAPIIDLNLGGFYTDVNSSVIDQKLYDKYIKDTQPIKDYIKEIAELSASYFKSGASDNKPALCEIKWLLAWAEKDALTGNMNQQGKFEQKWTLGSLALSYLRIKDEKKIKEKHKKIIEDWFKKIAYQIKTVYDDTNPKNTIVKNNHAYWAGMVLAAVGIAVNDETLFKWGINRYDIFINQVTDDGFLPLELNRKSKALHYHTFAAAPLVMLAEIGEANGYHLYAEKSSVLSKLVDNVIKGYADTSEFEKKAGEKQDPITKWDIAFLEIYNSRFHNGDYDGILKKIRPLYYHWLGYNLTLFYSGQK